MGFNGIHPRVNVYITMENHHVCWGKLIISMAMFNSYLKFPEVSTYLNSVSLNEYTFSYRIGPYLWISVGYVM